MGDISNKSLAALLVVAIVVSVAGTWLVVNQGTGMVGITGRQVNSQSEVDMTLSGNWQIDAIPAVVMTATPDTKKALFSVNCDQVFTNTIAAASTACQDITVYNNVPVNVLVSATALDDAGFTITVGDVIGHEGKDLSADAVQSAVAPGGWTDEIGVEFGGVTTLSGAFTLNLVFTVEEDV